MHATFNQDSTFPTKSTSTAHRPTQDSDRDAAACHDIHFNHLQSWVLGRNPLIFRGDVGIVSQSVSWHLPVLSNLYVEERHSNHPYKSEKSETVGSHIIMHHTPSNAFMWIIAGDFRNIFVRVL